jgi:hypothetical protein
VRLLQVGRETLAFVLNHAAQPARGAISLRLPAGATQAVDLVGQQPITLRQGDGLVSFDVQVESADARVIRLQP